MDEWSIAPLISPPIDFYSEIYISYRLGFVLQIFWNLKAHQAKIVTVFKFIYKLRSHFNV